MLRLLLRIVTCVVLVRCCELSAAEPLQLTKDGRVKSDLYITPKGDELFYVSEDEGKLLALRRYRFADKTNERINPQGTTSELAPSISADGRYLAYVRNDGNLHVQLVIEDKTSGEATKYNPGSGFAGIRYATLLPNAARLLFAFPEDRGQQIFSLSLDGKERTALTDGAGIDVGPRVSADSQRVVFASSREGNFEIYTMDVTGKALLQLTDHPALDTHPSWSPDGKQIAFASLRDGNFDLYIMQADGSNVRRVTATPEREDYPVWHPAGKELLYLSDRRGKTEIYQQPLP